MQTVSDRIMEQQFDPSLYYLANFHKALAWLRQRYADVLCAEEQAFIEQFCQVPSAAQALLVRMIMRKGPHFRASKLSYAEIGCPLQASGALLEAGWVRHDAALSLAELFGLLRKVELLECFAAHDHKHLKKIDLLQQLAAHDGQPQAFAAWCPAMDETVLSLTISEFCERLRLMFFGNLRQDWSEFVLADLGVMRYEPVALSDDSRAFVQRSQVDSYLALQRCWERAESGELIEDLLPQINAVPCDSAFLRARRDKLLYRMGQLLERQAKLQEAQAFYAGSAFSGARLRHLRMLERLGHLQTALELASAAALAPENDAEAQALPRMLARLHRQLGLPAPAKPRAPAPARIDLCLNRQADRVEYSVRDYLYDPEAPVHYVENSLICSLFGLLCWEAVFAPIPGAFFHPFHSGPMDLLDGEFRQRRAALFAACFAALDDGSYRQVIRRTYADKYGTQSPFVFWGALDETLLEQALDCLPAAHLRAWFERLLGDIKANRAGMPDLIQFWPAQKRYRMIEVKGPGDRLQDNQRRWLAFCAEHGMPMDVCYVQWADA
ncbi:VRR-NUC domain-containing protein [Pseudomonas borbori]